MRRIPTFTLAFVLALSPLVPLAGDSKNPLVKLHGTVVDMHCYVTQGAKGEPHTGCANACIERGVTAGFLADDGTLYVLLDEKPFSVKEKIAGLADVPATITGLVSTRGGIKGIQLQSIEKDKP